MNKNFLSQEEIDSLINKGNGSDEDLGETTYEINDIQKDIIGEVGNISMGTAATTLSSILNHQVLITTPRVSIVSFGQILEECNIPKVVANVEFKEGITGNNFLMVDVTDAAIIADLMMGGDGKSPNTELTELEISAVAEAMNQMIGSASTSMATMLNKQVDIQPPIITVWDSQENLDTSNMDKNEYICKIAFDLSVQGLIESEIMQVYKLETVEHISNIMLGVDDESAESVPEEAVVTPALEVKEEPKSEVPKKEEKITPKVEVQNPAFQQLEARASTTSSPRNLDLIMDVPLEFSVVLGKSKKTIKEVLSFGNGSIVELNKLADEPLEIFVNGKLIAEGEVVVINENFGVRITNILSKEQRVNNLK